MQVVTPSGTLSAPLAMQIVLDCTGGVGCPPPYNTPSKNCTSGPPTDLGAGLPDLTVTSCSPACTGATPFCNKAYQCVACRVNADCPNGLRCKTLGNTAVCVDACLTDAECQRRGDGTSRCCAGACVNPDKDPQNCGACGLACASPHAAAVCSAGQCGVGACDPDWADCNQQGADGCETNVAIDPQSCTACGRVCSAPHAISGCASACYVRACQAGFGDCDGEVKNGCETRTAFDVNNCSGCGYVCPQLPHATSGCNDVCVIVACDPGFDDCDGSIFNGCESRLVDDRNNCSACGNACADNQTCKGGVCG